MINDLQLFSETANPKLQRVINRSIVFHYIREYGPLSRAELSRILKISAPAVSRVVPKLIEDGYIIETSKLKTSSGKRPTLLELNLDKCFILGLDLGKDRLIISLSDFAGNIIKKYKGFKILDDSNIIEKVIKEMNEFIEMIGSVDAEGFKGIRCMAVAVPASVDLATGKVVNTSLYKSWRGLNFVETLGREFKFPIFVENDANLSALGEKYFGNAKEFKDIVYLCVSRGIGAGIIINNNLFRGSYGLAGEVGFTIVGTENLSYRAGDKGFLEQVASLDSMESKALLGIESGVKTIMRELVNGDLEKVDTSIIIEAAVKGDKFARDIINEMVGFLVIAIGNLILIVNPQIVLIGGGICNAPSVEELILKPIIDKLSRIIPFQIPKVELAAFGENAAIMGATFLAINSIIAMDFPYKISKNN